MRPPATAPVPQCGSVQAQMPVSFRGLEQALLQARLKLVPQPASLQRVQESRTAAAS
jgi:hypothetical protein